MNDAGAVRGGERIADCGADVAAARERKLVRVAQNRSDAAAAEQLHDEIGDPFARDAEVEHFHCISMRHTTRRHPLGAKPRDLLGHVGGRIRTEHFDGDGALQPEVQSTKDRAESTFADFLVDAIRVIEHAAGERAGKREKHFLRSFVRARQLFIAAL